MEKMLLAQTGHTICQKPKPNVDGETRPFRERSSYCFGKAREKSPKHREPYGVW